ncbi:MAG TPA: sigma-70 family RNA polymerase sigma factor [Pirellulales bacterium]|jgi:RNA polymerase sigma factor (sigma-70 family)|nr:sigma-70 family RNA polymerase sigma factor [Pirellulales bacterium]
MTYQKMDDEWFSRIRAGDEEAITAFVKEYEPEIRAEVRRRFRRRDLRRVLDSGDICQSVFKNFFASASLDRFEFDTPEALVKLLLRMVRNKVVDQVRRQQADRRDVRRTESLCPTQHQVVLRSGEPSPEELATFAELRTRLRSRLSTLERRIAELRVAGCSWNAVAEQLGEAPDAVRKRLCRAMDRVSREL